MKGELVKKESYGISQINKLLSSPLFLNIDEKINHTSIGENIKTPVKQRLKNSKFANLISELPDNELKVLTLVMGFSPNGMAAIKMFFTAENSRIQIYALKQELLRRGESKST